ncbi:MAG: FAD-dependent oxidoreductase [Anaerolineae bacterium]|nr:MAG: FAD-dependent oxidoreductase [Anaerolineae bacterium]
MNREQIWEQLKTPWDLVIIGGGISGAGILREATRLGWRVLLIEADDFAAGTSSRSSKLVHGGFRYLKNAQLKMTLTSVRERERLLQEGRGLITQLGFLFVHYQRDRFPPWVFGMGLALYDLLAMRWNHRYYDAYDILELSPYLKEEGLIGGYRYFDAQTDDARLVLRLLQESCEEGGCAINYCRAIELLRRQDGRVCGVAVRDEASQQDGRTAEIQAKVVINACGAWADELRAQVGGKRRLRKLRGSHLILPRNRLPIQRAVTFLHPRDRRPVFALPWEGVTLFGTTDVDHREALSVDASISPTEIDYLLSALQDVFPALQLSAADIQATFAGVRAVVDTGKVDPSKESREHVLWLENGLLTVSGGKLTTFRLMAHDALRAVSALLPAPRTYSVRQRVLNEAALSLLSETNLPAATRLRLLGRYGVRAVQVLNCAKAGELEPIAATPSLWAELRWAARAEAVFHLDDLLLRRVRLGLSLPQGGMSWIERIRATVQDELAWSDARWEAEVSAYQDLWKTCYGVPLG